MSAGIIANDGFLQVRPLGIVDLDARQVLRDGQPVHISLKAFELLRILITERPKALSKSELHERIWPATFVSDDSLAGLVAEAREAIGDRGRSPEFLRTIHGFGYAFAAVPEQPQHRRRCQPLSRRAGWSWTNGPSR